MPGVRSTPCTHAMSERSGAGAWTPLGSELMSEANRSERRESLRERSERSERCSKIMKPAVEHGSREGGHIKRFREIQIQFLRGCSSLGGAPPPGGRRGGSSSISFNRGG